MDGYDKGFVVFLIGVVLLIALTIIVVSIQEQAHSNFCQTEHLYSNSDYWCLNEDDGKLYAFVCDGVRFDGEPIDCYYKSNLVKEVG